MICLTLNGNSMLDNEKLVRRYTMYADVFELRLDCLDLSVPSEAEKALRFPSTVEKPVILCFRRKCDGGKSLLEENVRINLLKEISAGDFLFVDIEKDFKDLEFIRSLRERKLKIIRSYHNTECFPENLNDIFTELSSEGDIPKVSVIIRSISDLEKLFRLNETFKNVREKIIVGMGEYGIPSRILYRLTGSSLMYCSPEEVAPGMLDAVKMKELFRADKITENTAIFGLIGNPAIHSKSPEIHNPGFSRIGLDAVYVPFTVDNIDDFFRFASLLNIRGFSVTAPFKQDVMSHLDYVSEQCLSTGVCNTVIREGNKWTGYNTDYIATLSLFEGSRAIVIGAGGAAKAVVKSLVSKGFDVTVFNRTPKKAESLARESGCRYDIMENLGKYSTKADTVIKAVSTAEDIASDYSFSGNEKVCDLFYKPVMTPFLQRAEKSGCTIVTGTDFLLSQGKAQFELFVNTPLP